MALQQFLYSLFSNDSSIDSETLTEDFSEVRYRFKQVVNKLPDNDSYINVLREVNEWDKIHISIKQDGEILETFTNRNSDKFDDFISALNLQLESEIEVVFTIEKNKKDNLLSIYLLDSFTQYLESLSLKAFIEIIGKQINDNYLILFNSKFKGLDKITKSIALSNTINYVELETLDLKLRKDKKLIATTLCHWESENNLLLPEDIYPTNITTDYQKLIEIFTKASLLFTSMFFFDFSNLKENHLLYKLNGYRTFSENIDTSSIRNINTLTGSTQLLYEIYQWAYIGGNTNDKINIARNIISLNYNAKTLELVPTVFSAILSNYKIYERQNVKQYIEVRNKLSEILVDLQGKIDKIVSEFINDYKKNVITLLSFFITVIVIKVVSKGDFIDGFTNEIIILSYSFLIISAGLLIYSRWEFSNRISMFDKHYSQLKNRYKDLLSDNELGEIFNDCNPKECNSKSFVQKQRKYYSILWIATIGILAIALTIIFVLNNFDLILLIKKFLKTICYIQNI